MAKEIKQESSYSNTQLTVYNEWDNTVATTGTAKNDDEDDDVYHPEDDQMLCYFKTPFMTRSLTWQDTMRYNLQRKNLSVLRCDKALNKLFDCLSILREGLCLDDNIDLFLPKVSEEIRILPPKPGRYVYTVGKMIRGGMLPFYFFDFAKVKTYDGIYGTCLTISWSKQYLHNEAFGNLIATYNKYTDPIKMQNVVYVGLPRGPSQKTVFVRKFYNIRQEHNQRNYMYNKLLKSVSCDPFTLEEFDDLFKIDKDAKCSAEVEMLVGIHVEGYKESKDETVYETAAINKHREKLFYLSVKPLVFFKIEE